MQDKNKGFIKLGTYSEFTPHGNNYDVTHEVLDYNESKSENNEDDSKKEKAED